MESDNNALLDKPSAYFSSQSQLPAEVSADTSDTASRHQSECCSAFSTANEECPHQRLHALCIGPEVFDNGDGAHVTNSAPVSPRASSPPLHKTSASGVASGASAKDTDGAVCVRRRRGPSLREVSRVVSVERDGDYVQLNQYHLRDAIGSGSYGIVRLVHNAHDNTDYAMKILNKRRIMRRGGMFVCGRVAPARKLSGSAPPSNPLERVYREIAVLRKLDHPNVVKLVEVLDDPVDENIYLVFELMQRGPVLNVPTDRPLPETLVWRHFRDVLLGIEYLHGQKVIHRDIKPSNLLLDSGGRIKIADFGVCNEFTGGDAHLTDTSGTPAFVPPEALGTDRQSYSGRAADVWALGVTLFALVTGRLPFDADSVPALYERIRSQALSFDCGISGVRLSLPLRQLISGMLERDVGRRLTLKQLKQHNWVTADGRCPLPSHQANCGRRLSVSQHDLMHCIRRVTSVSAIILVRAIIKQKSFSHPYRSQLSKPTSVSRRDAPGRSLGSARVHQLQLSDRSNSAPCALPLIGSLAVVSQQKTCDVADLSPVTEICGD